MSTHSINIVNTQVFINSALPHTLPPDALFGTAIDISCPECSSISTISVTKPFIDRLGSHNIFDYWYCTKCHLCWRVERPTCPVCSHQMFFVTEAGLIECAQCKSTWSNQAEFIATLIIADK